MLAHSPLSPRLPSRRSMACRASSYTRSAFASTSTATSSPASLVRVRVSLTLALTLTANPNPNPNPNPNQASPRWRWRCTTLWQRTLPHSWSGCRRRCTKKKSTRWVRIKATLTGRSTFTYSSETSPAVVPNFLLCKLLQMHFRGDPARGETLQEQLRHGAARGTLLSD